jgi:hypothetical protein
MKSPFEIEQQVAWRRERLLAEARAERIAHQARTPGRSVLRARLAASLYALADRLSADPRALKESTPLATSTTPVR